MDASARRISRRCFLFAGATARPLLAAEGKGIPLSSDVQRYPDPATEFDVYRLTSPDYSSTLTAYYNRGIAHNSGWMVCASDRTGAWQGFRLDLKSGEMKQMTQAEGLDGRTLTLLPDNRSFCYLAGRGLYISNVTNL